MKAKLELTDEIVKAISMAKAEKEAYDWFDSTGDIPDATELYASAFEEGMRYMHEIIKDAL